MIQADKQFKIAILPVCLEWILFAFDAFSHHHFSVTIFILAVYWTSYLLFFYYRRGKKCQLILIPSSKKDINIGDIVCEKHCLAYGGMLHSATVCLADGEFDHNPNAHIVEPVIISDDLIENSTDVPVLDVINHVAYNSISHAMTVLDSVVPLNFKKIVLLEKDMPISFISKIVSGKVNDFDEVTVRGKNVFTKIDPDIFIYFLFSMLIIAILDIGITLIKYSNIYGPVIMGLMLSPVIYFIIKRLKRHFKNKKHEK